MCVREREIDRERERDKRKPLVERKPVVMLLLLVARIFFPVRSDNLQSTLV